METVKLSRRQIACMAELPEDYRIVGVERRAPLVRKPAGQIIRIQQDGSLIAPTSAGQAPGDHRFARERRTDQGGNAPWHESL
jgi:hypothetical protein